MSVLGFVGLPGSGKSEAATVAEDHDIPVVTMGDVIRAECRERGLDPATEHGRVAQALREENGPGAIAERSLPMIESELETSETVVVDGIRSDVEVDRFEERFGERFQLVRIDAPFETRKERLNLRGRDVGGDDGGETLADRDEREREFGMDAAMERADLTINNTGTLAEFRDQITTILTERTQ